MRLLKNLLGETATEVVGSMEWHSTAVPSRERFRFAQTKNLVIARSVIHLVIELALRQLIPMRVIVFCLGVVTI